MAPDQSAEMPIGPNINHLARRRQSFWVSGRHRVPSSANFWIAPVSPAELADRDDHQLGSPGAISYSGLPQATTGATINLAGSSICRAIVQNDPRATFT